ncbi:sensor histidine kinase [Winogradskyella sp.]|jgi:signal transduction histidine kinase|uniref:sensor histidine kinase n=1 Tax=Winogradskyella sp. TaxID=1883156 RepID=UPI0025DCD99D|nr:sensor histidine kinase [Winogradskyella sp.]MCT4629756.1 sensor histidine kinase [Winogradskyella sp.]
MLRFCFLIFTISQEEIKAEEIALITYVIFFTLVLVGTFVVFFTVFQKRKNQLLVEQIKQKQAFEEELTKTQQEIQEETLMHVGRELHDNVGQLLAFASMQMNSVVKVAGDDVKSKVGNASEALKESLAEVRALSRSLNSDVIFNLGLEATLQNEINRLNKSGLIEAVLNVNGEKANLENQKDEIILFRILQEFFSNTLKYAEADSLKVDLDYTPERLNINVKDNGVGFDTKRVQQGAGMTNMKKRAELINAQFQLESQKNNGTTLKLKYPYRQV